MSHPNSFRVVHNAAKIQKKWKIILNQSEKKQKTILNPIQSLYEQGKQYIKVNKHEAAQAKFNKCLEQCKKILLVDKAYQVQTYIEILYSIATILYREDNAGNSLQYLQVCYNLIQKASAIYKQEYTLKLISFITTCLEQSQKHKIQHSWWGSEIINKLQKNCRNLTQNQNFMTQNYVLSQYFLIVYNWQFFSYLDVIQHSIKILHRLQGIKSMFLNLKKSVQFKLYKSVLQYCGDSLYKIEIYSQAKQYYKLILAKCINCAQQSKQYLRILIKLADCENFNFLDDDSINLQAYKIYSQCLFYFQKLEDRQSLQYNRIKKNVQEIVQNSNFSSDIKKKADEQIKKKLQSSRLNKFNYYSISCNKLAFNNASYKRQCKSQHKLKLPSINPKIRSNSQIKLPLFNKKVLKTLPSENSLNQKMEVTKKFYYKTIKTVLSQLKPNKNLFYYDLFLNLQLKLMNKSQQFQQKEHAQILYQKGYICDKGQQKKAIQYFQKSKQILLKSKKDNQLLGKIYYRIAQQHFNLYYIEKTKDNILKSLKYLNHCRQKNNQFIIKANYLMGKVYYQKQDYLQCLQCFLQCIKTLKDANSSETIFASQIQQKTVFKIRSYLIKIIIKKNQYQQQQQLFENSVDQISCSIIQYYLNNDLLFYRKQKIVNLVQDLYKIGKNQSQMFPLINVHYLQTFISITEKVINFRTQQVNTQKRLQFLQICYNLQRKTQFQTNQIQQIFRGSIIEISINWIQIEYQQNKPLQNLNLLKCNPNLISLMREQSQKQQKSQNYQLIILGKSLLTKIYFDCGNFEKCLLYDLQIIYLIQHKWKQKIAISQKNYLQKEVFFQSLDEAGFIISKFGYSLDSVSYYEISLTLVDKIQCKPYYLEKLTFIADTLYNNRKYEKCLQKYYQCLRILQDSQQENEIQYERIQNLISDVLQNFTRSSQNTKINLQEINANRSKSQLFDQNQRESQQQSKKSQQIQQIQNNMQEQEEQLFGSMINTQQLSHYNQNLLKFIKPKSQIETAKIHKNNYITSLNSIAQYFYKAKNYNISLEYIEKLLFILQDAGDTRTDYSLYVSNRGFTLQCLQRYEQALLSFKKSLQIHSSLNAFNLDFAKILNSVGNVYFNNLNKSDSQQYFRKCALTLNNKQNKNRNNDLFVQCLIKIGQVLQFKEQNQQVLKHYENCLKLCQRRFGKNDQKTKQVQQKLTNFKTQKRQQKLKKYYQLNQKAYDLLQKDKNYEESDIIFKNCLQILQSYGEQESEQYVSTLFLISFIKTRTEKCYESIRITQRNLSLVRRLNNINVYYNYQILIRLGVDYYMTCQQDKSLQLFKSAQEYLNKLQITQDISYAKLINYQNIAEIYLHKKQYENVLKYLDLAYYMAQKVTSQKEITQAQILFLYVLTKQLNGSVDYKCFSEQRLQILNKLLGEKFSKQADLNQYKSRKLLYFGDYKESLNLIKKCLYIYQNGDNKLEQSNSYYQGLLNLKYTVKMRVKYQKKDPINGNDDANIQLQRIGEEQQ